MWISLDYYFFYTFKWRTSGEERKGEVGSMFLEWFCQIYWGFLIGKGTGMKRGEVFEDSGPVLQIIQKFLCYSCVIKVENLKNLQKFCLT